MTKLEAAVWNYSRAIKIAKGNGDIDVVEFLTPLYRSALHRLMREWDGRAGDTAA